MVSAPSSLCWAMCRGDGPARCSRALSTRGHSFLPVLLVLQSWQGWLLGTGMGMEAPYQDQCPASQPGSGLSSEAAASPSALGCHAQGPCWWLPYFHRADAGDAFPPIIVPPKHSCPRAVTLSGCQQPPRMVSEGFLTHMNPLLWSLVPWQPRRWGHWHMRGCV